MTNQEKKQYLSQYLTLAREVDSILEDLQIWRARAEKVTPSYSGLPKGGNDCDNIQAAIEAVSELEKIADTKIAALYQVKRTIEQAIEAVEEHHLRLLLRYKYLEGKTLEVIAPLIGFSQRHTERLHGEALAVLDLDKVGVVCRSNLMI